ncbi:MAG: N-6 DNA methylase [Patescibacteria group bacterium]
MVIKEKSKSSVKNQGRIYTPDFIVKNILDLVDYKDGILEKNIIDNSCGDGAFLIEIVDRYCSAFFAKNKKVDIGELKKHLHKYIHGIEIEKDEVEKCIENLNKEALKFGIVDVKWDVICADTLDIKIFDNKMDFVVGNPPYVRVHNLAGNYDKVKEFSFSQNGMTDLYIVFFEIGIKMLNSTGKMCLITPSSCLRSKAGENFRKFIITQKNLKKIVDLGHFQPFEATTYTMITLFQNGTKNDYIEYYTYNEKDKKPDEIEILEYADIFINGKINISKKQNLHLLHDLENYNSNILNKVSVKNGFATLADSVFIGNFKFNKFTINVLKASTNKWYKCIFPYNRHGRGLEMADLEKHQDIYNYLLSNKSFLESRSIEKNGKWYLFGRSQAINDVFKDKIAVNSIVKDKNSIKIEFVPAGSGVYGGLYILSDYGLKEIKDALINDEFIEYLRLLKNYKSGGYYTFSSSDLQKFLTYKLRKNNHEQSTIFTNNRCFA